MHLLNFCRRLLFASCFTVLSLQFVQAQGALGEQNTDNIISRLYQSLNSKAKSDMASRVEFISAQFLGKPYLLGALGEGEQGQYDQTPLYRTDAFDCETYVDTVLALALANEPNQFKRCIDQVRYRDGLVSFINRNHFTCLDWNQNNQRQKFVKDITVSFKDNRNQPVVKYARAVIDKPAWYNHMSAHAIRRSKASPKEEAKLLQSLKQRGNQLSVVTSVIPYIPLSVLFDSAGIANKHLFNQIPNAAIIEIIRPNWDLSKEIGTHLNVSHLGFAFWDKENLLFREASSVQNRVVDVPLIEYLRDFRTSPTIKGINIQIVLPQENNTTKCTLINDAPLDKFVNKH